MAKGLPVPICAAYYPNEPLVVVRGPIIQAQLIETMALLLINHQSLIATKANRMVRASEGRIVMEFGARRAHGSSAATLGARAAYIGGVAGSSNTLTDKRYGVPALGTMAHSWVQLFPTEYDAFHAYASIYPDSCILLVDTYDTLRSGIPNAIRVFDEVVTKKGFRPKGIRLDSGDIAYLSKEARKMLDEAGYADCPISASSGLDEFIIRHLIQEGAEVDSFGVGERLITSRSNPVFGGVYKLVAVEQNGEYIPKIKISANVEKITTPGFKNVIRIYDPNTNKAPVPEIEKPSVEATARSPV
jgi:nicotinate phosphoribosyltransferase